MQKLINKSFKLSENEIHFLSILKEKYHIKNLIMSRKNKGKSGERPVSHSDWNEHGVCEFWIKRIAI